jgi:beta-mannosidase
VELVAWSGARISDLQITTDSITPERAFLHARVELRVSEEEAERRAAGGGLPATLTLSSPGGDFLAVSHEAHLTPGSNGFRIPLEIPDPHLWWPNGLGEPHLYTVHAELRAGRRTDASDLQIGLRTVELVTEPDSEGESFYFRVNGVPVFMKGANVIPLDHFTPRVTEEDYRDLFQDVKDANMNMLRVWGGGIYENDVFYDLADRNGVLIWQDFMFANGMYPGDSAFLASVQAEATDQVKRLRNHPSLALWCGNNEMEEAWRNWGWARRYDAPGDSAAVREAYEAVFHRILPEVIAQEDPGRSYWPSSPSLGWGDPESLRRGDSHYWGVWHGQEPFEVFREKLPRFMSEYGFQALPTMETVEAFTEGADRSLLNPIFLVHQKHPIGNQLITEYMGRDFPVPSRFEDFLYVSQLLQARGMRTGFEAHRRALPRTMGTLYWQLNDTWPVVSWSSRDYFGRWKALHYTAREAFAPLILSPVLQRDSVSVWVVSDLQEPVVGTLQLTLSGFGGEILWERASAVTIGPNGSASLWTGSLEEVLGDADPVRSVLAARFDGEGGSGAENPPGSSPGAEGVATSAQALLFFAPPKDLALGTPTIRISGAGPHTGPGERGPWVTLTLETDLLARDVFLSLGPGEEGEALSSPGSHHFEENFFHLLPGHPRVVRLFTELPPQEVESRIRIRTLAEIPQEGVPADSSEAAQEAASSRMDPGPPP